MPYIEAMAVLRLHRLRDQPPPGAALQVPGRDRRRPARRALHTPQRLALGHTRRPYRRLRRLVRRPSRQPAGHPARRWRRQRPGPGQPRERRRAMRRRPRRDPVDMLSFVTRPIGSRLDRLPTSSACSCRAAKARRTVTRSSKSTYQRSLAAAPRLSRLAALPADPRRTGRDGAVRAVGTHAAGPEEAGVTAELLPIPSAGHGPNFPGAVNPPDYLGATVRWFDEHLRAR